MTGDDQPYWQREGLQPPVDPLLHAAIERGLQTWSWSSAEMYTWAKGPELWRDGAARYIAVEVRRYLEQRAGEL